MLRSRAAGRRLVVLNGIAAMRALRETTFV
jgi:hypothetical protein